LLVPEQIDPDVYLFGSDIHGISLVQQ
jgi:hypothetical protein